MKAGALLVKPDFHLFDAWCEKWIFFYHEPASSVKLEGGKVGGLVAVHSVSVHVGHQYPFNEIEVVRIDGMQYQCGLGRYWPACDFDPCGTCIGVNQMVCQGSICICQHAVYGSREYDCARCASVV